MRWNSLHLSKLILFPYQLAKYFICNTNTVESLPLTFVKSKIYFDLLPNEERKVLKNFKKGTETCIVTSFSCYNTFISLLVLSIILFIHYGIYALCCQMILTGSFTGEGGILVIR